MRPGVSKSWRGWRGPPTQTNASVVSGIYRLAMTEAAADVKGEDTSLGSITKGVYVEAGVTLKSESL